MVWKNSENDKLWACLVKWNSVFNYYKNTVIYLIEDKNISDKIK